MTAVIAMWRGVFKPGDVIVVNDPYLGMGHMPDVAVITPVFWQEQLVAFYMAYSHHTDTGGRFAGGFSSQCTESFEEGVCLPALKLYSEGKRNDALLDMILANVCTPDEWIGDVEAKVAGCWRGAQVLQRPVEKYGLDTFTSCCAHIMDYAEQATRAAIKEIPQEPEITALVALPASTDDV